MKTKHPFITGLKIHLDQGGRSFESSIRGWKEKELLIIDTPGEAGNIKKETEITCSLRVRTGSPVTFTTHRTGLLPEYGLTVLAYPEEIAGSDRLADARLTVTAPVNVRHEGDADRAKTSSAVMTDISMEGCQIKCSKLFTAGDRIVISGSLPSMEGIFEVTGEVRAGMKTKDESCSHGVLFIDEKEPGMEKLEEYINKVTSHINVQ